MYLKYEVFEAMCQTRVVFRLSGKAETGLHQRPFVITMQSLNKEIKFSIQEGKQHGVNLKLYFTCHMPKSNSKIVCVCVKNNSSSLLVLQPGEITHTILNKLKYLLHFICLPSTHYTTPSPTMIICCLDLETSCHPRGSCWRERWRLETIINQKKKNWERTKSIAILMLHPRQKAKFRFSLIVLLQLILDKFNPPICR